MEEQIKILVALFREAMIDMIRATRSGAMRVLLADCNV